MNYSPPGFSGHEISQVRILEWVAISFSRRSSWLRDRTHVSYTACIFFTAEPLGKPYNNSFSSVQFSSVQSLSHVQLFANSKCMNSSTPGLSVHHQLPEFTQTHVHRVGDTIQSSHPLSSPSPPAHNPSQHQGLFQWINSLHQVAKILEFQLQHQSFQWTPRTGLL